MWIKNPDPGEPKRPDPTGSGSATLGKTTIKHYFDSMVEGGPGNWSGGPRRGPGRRLESETDAE